MKVKRNVTILVTIIALVIIMVLFQGSGLLSKKSQKVKTTISLNYKGRKLHAELTYDKNDHIISDMIIWSGWSSKKEYDEFAKIGGIPPYIYSTYQGGWISQRDPEYYNKLSDKDKENILNTIKSKLCASQEYTIKISGNK